MSAVTRDFADVDATIARGAWWLRLFEELSRRAARRRDDLAEPRGGLRRGVARAADRAARGLRQALIAILWLERILAALAALRLRSAADIAAARARALGRATSRGKADLRWKTFGGEEDEEDEEDKEDEEDWREWDAPDRETYDREPRDPLVDALDRRLGAVDPILVDFDALGLRETVNRICADLGVTPDWSRWEAGDWGPPDTAETPELSDRPVSAAAASAPAGLPGSVPRPADIAPVGRVLAERAAERWRPRLE